MIGSAAAMPYSTPFRFTSIMRSHSSTCSRSSNACGISPALLIITSMRPKASTAASTRFSLAGGQRHRSQPQVPCRRRRSALSPALECDPDGARPAPRLHPVQRGFGRGLTKATACTCYDDNFAFDVMTHLFTSFRDGFSAIDHGCQERGIAFPFHVDL